MTSDDQLQQALRQSEARFFALIEALSEGIVIHDSEGKIIICNQSAERILGLSKAQLMGKTSMDDDWYTIRPDGSPFPGDEHPVALVLKTGCEQRQVLMGVHKPDGALSWIEINAKPIDDGQSFKGVAVSFVDVTHYERTKALLGRQAHFRTQLIAMLQSTFQSELGGAFFAQALKLAVSTIPGAQAGSLLTLEDDGKYHFAAIVGFDASVLQHIAFDPSELRQDLTSLEPQLIYTHHDPLVLHEHNAHYLAQDPQTRDIKVTLTVPIFIHGRLVAIFNLDNFESQRAFDHEAIEMAQTLATHIGVLWQRLQLETLQRYHREALRRQAYFREGLSALVQTALSKTPDEMMYQQFLETAVEVIPSAQAGSLMMRDERAFRFVAAVNFELDELRHVRMNIDDVERELGRAGPKIIRNIAARNVRVLDSDGQLRIRAARTQDIKVTLTIPIVLRDTTVAIFNLDNFDRDDAFTQETVVMGQIFAGQMAALLQRFELERELRKEREALEQLAFYDALTGLPNRTLLDERIRHAMATSDRLNRSVAVLFLDIDNFKHINDSLGHEVGDLFLKQVTKRLQGVVREDDTVARWGGDEFVVLLSGLTRPEDAAYVAQKIIAAMNEPFTLSGQLISSGVSIGIDVYPHYGKTAEALIKHADTALYRAKAAGKNTYLFFTQSMNEQLQLRLELERDLRLALLRDELVLYYQPRVVLASGAVTSVEALVRWQHPKKGLIPPSAFIPLAEETGLILPLGQRVIDLACAQAKAWLTAGTPQRVAVNVSVKQLLQGNLAASVAQALAKHELPAQYLEIEITESAAMTNVAVCRRVLSKLKALGVYLALDDFGTAYSSLSHLRQFPFDSIKIDRTFILELDDPSLTPDASIARAIVALGKSLGMTVIAEGVETQSQLESLRLMHCDEAQGYYFSRPLPAAALALERAVAID